MKNKNLTIYGAILFISIISFASISQVSALTRKQAVSDYVKDCEIASFQGYLEKPNADQGAPTLEATYSALKILDIIGEKPISNETYEHPLEIQLFLADLVNSTDGGYKGYKNGLESVKSTFHALDIYNMFNATGAIESLQKHVNFTLLSWNNESGGFKSSPSSNSSADVFNTYYALKTLEITGNLTQVNMTMVEGFLNSCLTAENLYASTNNSADSSLIATSFAIQIYKEFLNYTTFNPEIYNAISNRLGLNQASTGGIMDQPIINETLLSSAFYILKLESNLDLTILDRKSLTSWILERQDNSGGFIEGDMEESTATSSLTATYHAVEVLYIIDPALSALHRDVPWELDQLALILSIVIFLGVIVLVVVLSILYYRKNKAI
ncbi:MAG: prenyltransferase/squalene oxidase repeat-containing protein [Promethearchaeota archaeon]